MTLNNPNQNINYYYSNFVEEMPNKEQIIAIVKSTRYLLEFILNSIDKGSSHNSNKENDIQILDSKETMTNKPIFNNNSVYLEKACLISNKILRIYMNLSRNFYGQSIILHSEFDINGILSPIHLKQNPSLILSYLQNYIINKLSNLELGNIINKISINLLEITHNYLMIILLSFYDCLYFEYASIHLDGTNGSLSNTILSNNIFTADFLNDLSEIKCIVTDTHLASILSCISGIEINKENIFEVSYNIQEMFIFLNSHLEKISSKYYQKNDELFNQFNFIEESLNNMERDRMADNIAASNEANNLVETDCQETLNKIINSCGAELSNNGNDQENSDNVNFDINTLESQKEFNNTQKDEVFNLVDTEMNTNNLNNSTYNINTPNNNFIDSNINKADNSFESLVSRQKTMKKQKIMKEIRRRLKLMY